ncbi:MAG: L-serine ammonia-lyase, iron-sulfur-dependent, subunit alpha [Mycoplasma sp.]
MQKKDFIKKLIGELVVSAYGCTEIGVIGYPCALCYEQLKGKGEIKSIEIEMSPFVFKNASRVGVPNLGQCGIPMMTAVGAYICKPERKLELFSSVTEEEKAQGKKLVDENKVTVKVKNDCDPVYCHVKMTMTSGDNAECLIEKGHEQVIYLKVNDKEVGDFGHKEETEQSTNTNEKGTYTADDFTVRDLYDIVMQFDYDDLSFLEKVFYINQQISSYGVKNAIPGSFTETFDKSFPRPRTWKQEVIYKTCAAIDARMSGASMPVMSSCGSGDHGLTLSIPQYIYHILNHNDPILFLRGLCLANLITWKIKYNIGALSSMCGSVVAAATGAFMGMGVQLKFTIEQLESLFEALLCQYAGVICDGAKMSCTYKVAGALNNGFMVLNMIQNGYKVNPLDGIVAGNCEKTLSVYRNISKNNSKEINKSIVEKLNEISHEN